MKTFSLILFFMLICGLMLSACSPQMDMSPNTRFSFEYEGEQYEIVGYATTADQQEANNDFIKRKNDHVVFWYRDYNQDGYLDQAVLEGVGLREANEIYLAGITLAMQTGSFKEKKFPRRFDVSEGDFSYELVSLGMHSDRSYNLFVVKDSRDNQTWTIRDLNRDGILDDPLLEPAALLQWQSHYDIVLQKGMQSGKILLDEMGYLVEVHTK